MLANLFAVSVVLDLNGFVQNFNKWQASYTIVSIYKLKLEYNEHSTSYIVHTIKSIYTYFLMINITSNVLNVNYFQPTSQQNACCEAIKNRVMCVNDGE